MGRDRVEPHLEDYASSDCEGASFDPLVHRLGLRLEPPSLRSAILFIRGFAGEVLECRLSLSVRIDAARRDRRRVLAHAATPTCPDLPTNPRALAVRLSPEGRALLRRRASVRVVVSARDLETGGFRTILRAPGRSRVR